MQKVLRKRVLRDLKENRFRYFALGLLIILVMFIVVSLISAAETVITGTNAHAEKNHVEDGEFQVFVPLSEKEETKLEDRGLSLERMFYFDYSYANDKIIRIYKNRNNINLVELDEGVIPETTSEIVLEKQFSEINNLKVKDQINIGEMSFTITGIGSTPDYDAAYQGMSDAAVDSNYFGTAFVTNECYEKMKLENNSNQSEQYYYAYLLNDTVTNSELKEVLDEYEISTDSIDDPYFKEYWEENGGKRDELLEGLESLKEGGEELKYGLGELSNNTDNIVSGADKILSDYIYEASSDLKAYGLEENLTEENFEVVLNNLNEKSENPIWDMNISSLNTTLKGLKKYKDGVIEYTKGVDESLDGGRKLDEGIGKLNDSINDLIDNYMDISLTNVMSITVRKDNPRILAAAGDVEVNKSVGLMAGVVMLILLTYVISVFVIHGIEKESSVIGALYALGVTRKDLIAHYITLPVVVTFVSGIIGTLIGVSSYGIGSQLTDTYNYFSFPILSNYYPVYILIYGIVLPPVIAGIVNYFVIRKHLSKNVLTLMHGEQKKGKNYSINNSKLSFIVKFQVKHMLKERRTGIAVTLGMFISMLVFMLAFNCYVYCKQYSVDCKLDTKYEYMYTYKYPDRDVILEGEEAYVKLLRKENLGYNLDVVLLGINEDNPYFDAKCTVGRKDVVISSAVATKFNISEGESFVVSDQEEERDYAFTVGEIVDYNAGLYMFMNIDSMRQLFGESETYYNVVFSDKELPIESGRLYNTTSKTKIAQASDIFLSKMKSMIIMLLVCSVLIFVVVLYLMMKVMIERASFDIALFEILGYRTEEIKKLYLNGNFYMIAVGTLLCIPLSKVFMDTVYPYMVPNVSAGIMLSAEWWMYVVIYFAVIVLYFVINSLIVRKLKRIVPAQILKNR